MKRGHAHEEDGRARRVDVLVHPARPGVKNLPVRLDPHELVMVFPVLPARSPAIRSRPHHELAFVSVIEIDRIGHNHY